MFSKTLNPKILVLGFLSVAALAGATTRSQFSTAIDAEVCGTAAHPINTRASWDKCGNLYTKCEVETMADSCCDTLVCRPGETNEKKCYPALESGRIVPLSIATKAPVRSWALPVIDAEASISTGRLLRSCPSRAHACLAENARCDFDLERDNRCCAGFYCSPFSFQCKKEPFRPATLPIAKSQVLPVVHVEVEKLAESSVDMRTSSNIRCPWYGRKCVIDVPRCPLFECRRCDRSTDMKLRCFSHVVNRHVQDLA